MAQVQKKYEPANNLTIIVFSGKVTVDEIVDAIEDYYRGGITTNLIWDYTSADLTVITSDQLQHISSVAQSYAHLRKDGKTAIVMPDELGFGIGRMYEIFNEMNEVPIQYHIFKHIDEAMHWLKS